MLFLKNIHNLLIVGLGLIGGSYARGLSKQGYLVSAIDINGDSIQYALDKGWIAEGSIENDPEMIHKADLIISGLYPQMMVDWIQENHKYFKSGIVMTDVSGVKSGIVDQIQAFLREDVEFIGSHPMAGKEVSGVQYADETIFEHANFIITPTKKNSEEAIALLTEFAQELHFGNITILSLAEHDRMIGFVSQLTHTIAVSLMNCKDHHDLKKYTGDSFRELTRIAKINEVIWTELFLLNKENLVQEMDAFLVEMKHLRDTIHNEDVKELQRLLKQSTQRRIHFDK